MGFKELSIACRNRASAELGFPAKAQRRKDRKEEQQERNGILRDQAKTFAALRLCGKLLLGLALTLTVSAQGHRAMFPADILRLANISDAQMAPNGELV